MKERQISTSNIKQFPSNLKQQGGTYAKTFMPQHGSNATEMPLQNFIACLNSIIRMFPLFQ